MQARPDARLGHLLEGLREPVEVACLTGGRRRPARHAEPDVVRLEEHLQDAEVCAVEAEIPDGCSGHGAVMSQVHDASGSVAGLPSLATSWIACHGRQKSQ